MNCYLHSFDIKQEIKKEAIDDYGCSNDYEIMDSAGPPLNKSIEIKEEISEFSEYTINAEPIHSPVSIADENFGVKKMGEGKQKSSILLYDSKKYPGRVYRFQKNKGKKEAGGTQKYSCLDCIVAKREATRKRHIPCRIPVPFIEVVKNKILTDPDKLEIFHMCDGYTKKIGTESSQFAKASKDKEWEKKLHEYISNIDRKARLKEASVKAIKKEPVEEPMDTENIYPIAAETVELPASNSSTPVAEENLQNSALSPQNYRTKPTRASVASKNFGVAKTVIGSRGGMILTLGSKKEPGKLYRFRAYKGYKNKKNAGAKKYLCIDCIAVKQEATKKKCTPCTNPVPYIYVYGNTIATDPENTTSCHFCEGWKSVDQVCTKISVEIDTPN